ncbi:LOW QUALITY PROTEIN: uncharacterized protein LOC144820125 [Lissotriton helveticus]
MMEVNEGGQLRKGKKRGPYKKWLLETEHFIKEADDNIIQYAAPKKIKEGSLQTSSTADDSIPTVLHTSPSAEHCTLHSDNSTALPDYTPPVDDTDGDPIDAVWDTLCSSLKGEMDAQLKDDLINDSDSGFEQLMDQVGYTIQNEYEEIKICSDQTNTTDESTPIFEGSNKCLGVVILLLCCFIIRFRLSDEAAGYMLNLIYLLLPRDNRMFKTMYHLHKYIKKSVKAPHITYYCATCYTHVDKNTQTCPNQHCLKDLIQSDSVSYFIQHSLIAQLQTMFRRKHFTEKVRKHRFDHYMENEKQTMKDVYDGEMYLDLFKSGFLKNPNSLSFAMNTDGVPVFKSSKISMWPVYLMVNELPVSQRKLRENILLYGIWVSTKKPIMWSFLKPLYEELAQLESGVSFQDHNNCSFTCHATLLTITCDLPARCLVSNSTQFNGKFGCWHCLQEGEVTVSGKGHCRVFPYNAENPKGPPRTLDTIKSDVNSAIANIESGLSDYSVRGIKGPMWFMFLKHFCVTRGFVIDYMHGVCSGIMKLLMTIWFTKEYKHHSYSFYDKVKIVNVYLKQIKPTLDVSRVPRSVDELPYWKASEFRNFLLFYGMPVLKHVLDRSRYLHFCLLMKAIHKLLNDDISQEDLNIAEQCLLLFVQLFNDLYEKRFLTMNVHQLVHLVDSVRATGPLFTANCFVFEDLNGFLLQHVHGTVGIETQILDAVNMIQVIPVLMENHLPPDSVEAEFYQSMMCSYNRKRQRYLKIEKCIYSVGSTYPYSLTENEYIAVTQLTHILGSDVVAFNKIFLEQSNLLVYSSNYTRIQRRDQSVIKYETEPGVFAYGRVTRFIQCKQADVSVNLALLVPLKCEYYDIREPVHLVVVDNNITAISLSMIKCACFYIQVENESFVSEMPNRFEID